MFRARMLSLLVCASLVASVSACAGSMQSATTTGVVKRPVRASKGSVEQSAARK